MKVAPKRHVQHSGIDENSSDVLSLLYYSPLSNHQNLNTIVNLGLQGSV